MEYRSLYEVISCLQYGTKLHISVLFFNNYGNKKCTLPHEQTIHASPICNKFKEYGKHGFRRCFACRNLAIKKAMTDKKPFGGLCINGIYEYLHPVIINGDVACIIFIGNIINSFDNISAIDKKTGNLSDTAEQNFGYDKCSLAGELLEAYIRLLIEKYPLATDDDSLIDNIKNYIISNLEFDINISDVAEIFHYNKQYLGRLFKKNAKQSINEFICTQRIARAEHLLKTTKFSVIDISNMSGFNNVTYFNRLFKATYGVTPTEYRKKVSS